MSAPLGHLTAPALKLLSFSPSVSARWLEALPPPASQVVSKCALRIVVETNAHIYYNLIKVDEMTNMQILIEAIRIIAEKSETKEEFLKELDRLPWQL